MLRRSIVALLGILCGFASGDSAADREPVRKTWTVGPITREALVFLPESTSSPAPVVFAFHGHGGGMKQAAQSLAIHKHWPEALVVYMQGLPTPGRLTDPEGKRAGWQHTVGEQQDRDLKFFDAVLKTLQADYRIDTQRIYATGHSNGGGFTYLLWATRGETFAAVAPSAAVGMRQLRSLKPKPVMHLAGETDDLVKFAWQRAMLDRVRTLNGCASEGKPAGKHQTLYPSKIGTPVVEYIHPGGHKYPAEASPAIVAFFKEHTLKK